MLYVSNAFSLSMIASLPPQGATVKVAPISLGEVKALLKEGFESAVGHESTAQLLSTLLGVEVPPRRVQIRIGVGDVLIVFQLLIRLAEGQILSADEVAALLQEGKATFYKVEVEG